MNTHAPNESAAQRTPGTHNHTFTAVLMFTALMLLMFAIITELNKLIIITSPN
jgi:hypothetical protein